MCNPCIGNKTYILVCSILQCINDLSDNTSKKDNEHDHWVHICKEHGPQSEQVAVRGDICGLLEEPTSTAIALTQHKPMILPDTVHT